MTYKISRNPLIFSFFSLPDPESQTRSFSINSAFSISGEWGGADLPAGIFDQVSVTQNLNDGWFPSDLVNRTPLKIRAGLGILYTSSRVGAGLVRGYIPLSPLFGISPPPPAPCSRPRPQVPKNIPSAGFRIQNPPPSPGVDPGFFPSSHPPPPPGPPQPPLFKRPRLNSFTQLLTICSFAKHSRCRRQCVQSRALMEV